MAKSRVRELGNLRPAVARSASPLFCYICFLSGELMVLVIWIEVWNVSFVLCPCFWFYLYFTILLFTSTFYISYLMSHKFLLESTPSFDTVLTFFIKCSIVVSEPRSIHCDIAMKLSKHPRSITTPSIWK